MKVKMSQRRVLLPASGSSRVRMWKRYLSACVKSSSPPPHASGLQLMTESGLLDSRLSPNETIPPSCFWLIEEQS